MKPSQKLAGSCLAIGAAAFVLLLFFDSWFPWWIDLIAGVVVFAFLFDESMKQEARKRLVDRDMRG